MVRQHPNLVEGFKVWEDCVTGAEPCRGIFLNVRQARKKAAALSERWGFGLDIDAHTASLTVSRRQKAAVLALLVRGAEYFIFDEPTAVLSPAETQGLFALFKSLRDGGKGIVLISHKLDETLGLADRVTVLRKGKTAAVRDAESLSGDALRTLMFGQAEPETNQKGAFHRPQAAKQQDLSGSQPGFRTGLIFHIENMRVEIPGRPFIRGISLDAAAGHILGIAGVRDSGLETLELAAAGLLRPSAGRITLQGRDISGGGVRAFRNAGGGYLGAGRTGSAFAPALPITDSMIIHAYRRARRGFLGRLGFLDQGRLDSWTKRIIDQAEVQASPKALASSLSGGMAQRLMLAREFAEDTCLMIMAEPSWGLDGLSRAALSERLRDYTRGGRAVLLFSTDVDELLAVCDEILTLRNGRLGGRIILRPELGAPEHLSVIRERIGKAMVSAEEEAASV
jgi:simple sugar transport system ATP-binding protein